MARRDIRWPEQINDTKTKTKKQAVMLQFSIKEMEHLWAASQ